MDVAAALMSYARGLEGEGSALLIDIKSTFNNASKSHLCQRMATLGLIQTLSSRPTPSCKTGAYG